MCAFLVLYNYPENLFLRLNWQVNMFWAEFKFTSMHRVKRLWHIEIASSVSFRRCNVFENADFQFKAFKYPLTQRILKKKSRAMFFSLNMWNKSEVVEILNKERFTFQCLKKYRLLKVWATFIYIFLYIIRQNVWPLQRKSHFTSKLNLIYTIALGICLYR